MFLRARIEYEACGNFFQQWLLVGSACWWGYWSSVRFIYSKHKSGRRQKSHSICGAFRIRTALLRFIFQWSCSKLAGNVKKNYFCCFHSEIPRLWKRKRFDEIFRSIISEEDKEPFPVIPPSVKKGLNSTFVTWTLTLNSCFIYRLVSDRSRSFQEMYYKKDAEKLVDIKAACT